MNYHDSVAELSRRSDASSLERTREEMGQGPGINAAQVLAAQAMLVGMSVRWWGEQDPPPVEGETKFLNEDGRLLSGTLYPELYALLGTRFNAANDPLGFFRIPDSRDRTGVGASVTHPLGSEFGSETHTLTAAQSPVHSHSATVSVTSQGHNHGGGTGIENAQHAHGYTFSVGTRAVASGNSFLVLDGSVQTNTSGAQNANHAHAIGSSDTSHGHGVVVDAAGGGQAHPNVQPSIGVHYAIRVLP